MSPLNQPRHCAGNSLPPPGPLLRASATPHQEANHGPAAPAGGGVPARLTRGPCRPSNGLLRGLISRFSLLALLASCFLLLSPSEVLAATYYRWYPNINPVANQPRYATPQEACTYVVVNSWGLPGPGSAVQQDPGTYNCKDNSGGQRGTALRTPVTLTCTAPATPVFTGSGTAAGTWVCQNPPDPTCPDAIGSLRTINVTDGWARSSKPNADDLVITNGGLPTTLDDGKCLGTVTDVKACWRSQVPAANGLYRVSCDYVVRVDGDSTGNPSDAADPTTPMPSCPGFVGEVNGVTVCVGSANSPLPSPSPSPGSEGAGNPSAGPKPPSGEGSGTDGPGRTPTNGSGSNPGGPAAAANPPPSDTPPTEVKSDCGIAGKPACAVDIDESGTPSPTGAFSTPQSSLDTYSLEREQGISSAGNRGSLPWIWGFNLPSGACAPIDLSSRFGVASWSACEDENVLNFRAAWGYLVVAFGALYAWRSLTGAVGSGGR